ncbi:MAG: hypothetical protein EBR82_20435 [Caulobacteraceae bacterium]|nr:hypothetical protein [Caulobacteraceae bacterium]
MVAAFAGLAASAFGGGIAMAQSAAQTSASPHPTPLEYRSRTRTETPQRAAGTTTLTPWLEEWARDRAERPVRDQEALDAEANAAIADPDSGIFVRDAVGLGSQVRTVADRVRQVQARDAMQKSTPTVQRAALTAPSMATRMEPAVCRDCLSPDLRDWARQRAYGPAGDAASLRAEAEAVTRASWSGVPVERAGDPVLIEALTAYLAEQMRERRG